MKDDKNGKLILVNGKDNNNTPIHFGGFTGILHYHDEYHFDLPNPQHIYLISIEKDEKIEIGDWYITKTNRNFNRRAISQLVEKDLDLLEKFKSATYKIIASTDRSLDGIPFIKKMNIEHFVKKYNEGLKEQKVLISYNENGLSLSGRGGDRCVNILSLDYDNIYTKKHREDCYKAYIRGCIVGDDDTLEDFNKWYDKNFIDEDINY